MKIQSIMLFSAAIAGALALQPLQAVEPTSAQETRHDRIETLKENLGLSAEQSDKIRPILQAQREQFQKLRQDTTMSREQKLEKVREMLKSTAEEIRPILTPEQQEKWTTFRDNLREEYQNRLEERATGAASKTQ